MDVYIERQGQEITLEEWRHYVSEDGELLLEEETKGFHPITQISLTISMPGRVLYKGWEIRFRDNKIGTEGREEELMEKLRRIAEKLGAVLYDCGEEL